MSTIRITALPAASGVTSDDLFPMENDPAGTPVTQKATAAQVNTGIRAVAASVTVSNLTPDSSEFAINTAQANVDLRVKGATDATLFCTAAGTDRVGIGTSTPTTKLQVVGTATATAWQGDGSALTSVAGTATSFQSLASDPGSPTNGDVWYNTATNVFKGRVNGVTKTFTQA